MNTGVYFSCRAKTLQLNQTREEISEIIPGKLYLGSLEGARDLKLLRSKNITHILNVSGYPCAFDKDFDYKSLAIEDGCDDISKHFKDANDFIGQGNVVFVHCHGGVSRSSTLVIAHLMMSHEMSLEQALDHVKVRRPIIKPHFLFQVALEILEENLDRQRGILIDPDQTDDDDVSIDDNLRYKR